MKLQIVIFLGFIAATLVVNALVIWFTYKAFANMTTKVTETALQFRASSSTRGFLQTLQAASAQSVVLTASAKQQMDSCEAGLARTQTTLGYGLAKVDVRFERACDRVRLEADKAQAAILRPTLRFGAAAAGVLQVLLLFSETENDDGANSTLNQ
jgi:hypothetical protein